MRVPVDSPRRQVALAEGPEGSDGERDLSDRIASRLHQLRSERKWSLDHLARASGVSRALLWQIEQDRSTPTIKVLSRVADALCLPLTSFLETAQPPAISLLRRHGAKRLRSGDGLCSSRALFPYRGLRDVEFYELTLEPGGQEISQAHPAGTHENLVVALGIAEIDVGDAHYRLERGDALYFSADIVHVYRNPGTEPTVIFLVMSHPNRLNYG